MHSTAYIYLAGYLNDLLLPQVPQALDVNLYVRYTAYCNPKLSAEVCLEKVNMGLYLVFLAVAVTGMGLQWLMGNLWFLRRRHTQLGEVVLPNSTALFALFSSVFCVAAIVDMALLVLVYDRRM